MASFNRVILVGNLTRDVELRYTPNGTAVTDIGLAINNRTKQDGNWVNDPLFLDVTLWARLAEIAAQYLSKGSSILVEGRLKREEWEAEVGGEVQKRSKIRIVGEKLQMLTPKNGGGDDAEPVAANSASDDGDAIPF